MTFNFKPQGGEKISTHTIWNTLNDFIIRYLIVFSIFSCRRYCWQVGEIFQTEITIDYSCTDIY